MSRRTLQLEVNEMSTEAMWEKVLARDAAADGRFVYAVRSTHIYCRPTCPSKRPNREQVEFFASPKDAEQRGYRACRRCAPKTESRADHVARICRELTDEYRNLGPEQIAQHEGIPLRRLNEVFRGVLGVTVREYLASAKLDDFKEKVKQSGDVTTSMYDAGFGSSSRLYGKSDAVLGMTPASYGRGGRGATIHFGVRKSSLGYILTAATHRGVCTISLGDNAKKLEEDLRADFHAATISRDDSRVATYLDAIADHIAGTNSSHRFPSIFRPPPFKPRSGSFSARPSPARLSRTAASPPSSAIPRAPAPWHALALPTAWPSPFPAIALSPPPAISPAIAGAWSASKKFWSANAV